MSGGRRMRGAAMIALAVILLVVAFASLLLGDAKLRAGDLVTS
ncbi:hypothetical protein GCM10022381_38340 [Leifsonia kafniensis]|uniref:Uncharacterized protein n=1 Tax=Leifsonia kafniensis TaxID=475957 RepID=A0ABP7L137_9MICO